MIIGMIDNNLLNFIIGYNRYHFNTVYFNIKDTSLSVKILMHIDI